MRGSTVAPGAVSGHYARPALIEAIREGIVRLGRSPQTVTFEELAAIDEFHIGGRAATDALIRQLRLTDTDHVLDIGCGLGGTARFITTQIGCHVTGIDLTPDYIETGAALCRWLRLDRRISLQCANALAMPFADGQFTASCMLHVGMNIPNKFKLFEEISRVLTPGSTFGLYDVMREADGELPLPLPWTTTPSTNAIATLAEYTEALQCAGFILVAQRSRREFALAYFAEQQARSSEAAPGLGLHVLMGERRREQVRNMIASLQSGLLAPVEIIARKA